MRYIGFSSGYRPFTLYWFRHWLQPRTYWRPFLWLYQRATRGWADCDTWSLDHYLDEVLAEAIEHLRKHNHGYPPELTEQKWDTILAQMVEGFKANLRVDDFDYSDSTEFEVLQERAKRGMKLFVKYRNHLWD